MINDDCTHLLMIMTSSIIKVREEILDRMECLHKVTEYYQIQYNAIFDILWGIPRNIYPGVKIRIWTKRAATKGGLQKFGIPYVGFGKLRVKNADHSIR